jgi:hypothetical protein
MAVVAATAVAATATGGGRARKPYDPPRRVAMGRGTTREAGGGGADAPFAPPSAAYGAGHLPIPFGDREDQLNRAITSRNAAP